MTAFKGFGTTGNGAGVVTPLDHKLANASGLVKTTTALTVRTGVFYNNNASLITGKANMSYDVSAYFIATQRSAAAGVVFGGNDGTLNVVTTAAPGSNSRIDIIYHWHREFTIDGTDSNPVIGVAQGTAAAVPVAPSLASFPGAIEIGRATVGAGIVATTSATITQTAPFTAVHGGKVPFRTTTEMNLWTTAILDQQAIDLSSGITYRYNGSAWKAWDSDEIAFTPTMTNYTIGTGGSASNTGTYQYINGRIRLKHKNILGTVGASVGTEVAITLPVASATPTVRYKWLVGAGSAYDSSAVGISNRTDYRHNSVSTTSVIILTNPQTPTNLAATAPFTWAAGDELSGEFWYDPA